VITFRVGLHDVQVWMKEGRWYVSVDGTELSIWYKVQADAWTAGVIEADRLDRPAEAASAPGGVTSGAPAAASPPPAPAGRRPRPSR
jgi:hypothetical protein